MIDINQPFKNLPAGSIIAGGWPRDIMLGLEPRDMDVYVPFSSSFGHKLDAADHITRLGQVYTTAVNGIHRVWRQNIIRFAGTEVDIIMVDSSYTPEGIINNFDCELCKVYITEDGTMCYTKGFEDDVKNNTITFVGAERTPHKQKMRNKFPDRRVKYTPNKILTWRVV